MDKRWLRAYGWRQRLRVYGDFVFDGALAVVIDADDKAVTVITHNAVSTYEARVPWAKFVHDFMLAPDRTAEQAALALRNDMRTIYRPKPQGVALRLEHFIDAPPSLEDVVVKKPKSGAKEVATAVVRSDYNNHTCIEISRNEKEVRYVPLAEGGLDECSMGIEAFDQEYCNVLRNYPVEKAAVLYVEFAQHLGATPRAMDILARFTTVGKKEYEMATAKPVTESKKPAAVAKGDKTKAAPKVAQPKATEKKPSAAAMFQELIMEGKLTDAEIFAKVQAKFSLADDRRSYVTWYRNYLTKHGKNPPAAKDDPKEAKKEPAVKKAVAADKKEPAAKKAPVVKKSTTKPATADQKAA